MPDSPQVSSNLLHMYGEGNALCTQVNFKFFLRLSGLDQMPRSARILDCGCAVGHLLELLHRNGFTALWGIDSCTEMVQQAQKLGVAKVIEGDVLDLGRHFSDGSLDAVILSGILHHIPDEKQWERLFAACYRALTDRGVLFIREPYPNLPFRVLKRASRYKSFHHGFLKPHLLGYETEKDLLDYFLDRWLRGRSKYLSNAGFRIERDRNWWVHRITTARIDRSPSSGSPAPQ